MDGASAVASASSLRRRTLTAFALGPLVIAAVLWLPTPGFALFFTLVVLASAWEWCALAGIESRPWRVGYLLVLALAMGALWLWPGLQLWSFGLSVLWWGAQTRRLLLVQEVGTVSGPEPGLLPVGLLVLVVPWAALIHLHAFPRLGPESVLALLILIWTADSLAYFVGRRWGRAKLAPAVSPGKTRAGVYGALAGAAVCGLVFAGVLGLDLGHTLLLVTICGLTAMISVVGDLYESLLKRRRGLKDSSQLLPGHGGLLDRIDSLTAAAPLFVLGLTWALT